MSSARQLIAFAVVAAVFLFKLTLAHVDIDPGAVVVLKRWVGAEYRRYQLDRTDISLEQKAELVASTENIEFLSINARGKPERMVFRVELAPHPAKPINRSDVRYYRMDHSLLLGWSASVPKRADALIYFLALFML